MRKLDERAEALIREAQDLSQGIATLKARRHLVENELDAYFPKASQVEQLVTTFGSAHRVLHEDIYLDPGQVEEVKAMLGSEFSAYFSFVPLCRPTEALSKKLVSADSYLGQELRGRMVIKRERHFAYSPGRRIVDVKLEESA